MDFNKLYNLQTNVHKSSVSTLIEFIEQGKNAEFKTLVSSVNGEQDLNIVLSVLFRKAIEFNNIELITYLYSSGCDVEIQNILGETPLHCALRHQKYQAVVHLLLLNANLFALNYFGETALQFCFQEQNQVPDYVVTCFFDALKKLKLSASQTTDYLEQSNCSIRQVLLLQDVEITSQLLDRRSFMDDDESRVLLEIAMNSNYPDNVRALLYHGPDLGSRLRIYWDRVIHYMWHPSMGVYFDKLVEWEVIDAECLDFIVEKFACERAEVIQRFLNIGVDEYIDARFGSDVKVYLFVNNLTSDELQSLLENTYFDVNSRERLGICGLHLAAWSKNDEAADYLLSNGADPNLADSMGRIPILYARDEVTFALLMEYGADLRVLNDTSLLPVVDPIESRLLAAPYYVLYLDVPLEDQLREYVDLGIDNLNTVEYEQYMCLRDLEWMDTVVINGSVTLFTCLLETTGVLAKHIKNNDAVNAILDFVSERESKIHFAYATILENNLSRAVRMNELKGEAAEFLCGVMGLAGTDHLVIECIVTFLTHQDLLVFEGMNDMMTVCDS